MSTKSMRPTLSHSAYRHAADQLTTFYGALPPDAVRDLALEGFRRLAERRKVAEETLRADIPDTSSEHLCTALLSKNREDSLHLGKILLEESSVEDFYLVHLSGAATLLGDLWERDEVSFVDVAVGLGRLHALVRSIEQPVKARAQIAGKKKAIFATVPGERHTLGVTMATDLFRRKGWHILLLVGLDHDALVSRIAEADAAVLGLSAAGKHAALPLARLLVDLRVMRPECRVFVSGKIVTEAKSLVQSALPDGIACTVSEAENLLTKYTTV